MQTFLPYPCFKQSAKCLDPVRLRNQRREVSTILNGGWKHHTATKMWEGHHYALCYYGIIICLEVKRRGWADNTRPKYMRMLKTLPVTGMPWWLGLPEFHASHRSNLLRKDEKWYSQFGWEEPNDLEYVWPTKMEVDSDRSNQQ